MVQHAAGLDIGSVVSRTFNIWLKNFVPFSVLAFVVVGPVILYSLFGPLGSSTQVWLYAAICGFGPAVAGFVTSAAVTYGVFQQMRGTPVALGQCVSVGLRRILPVIGVGLTVGVLVFLGLLLLVVPGIILACIFYVAVPAAVVERVGVGQALGRSAALTKGVRTAVFGIALILGIVTWAAGMVVDFLIPDPSPSGTYASVAEAMRHSFEGLRLQTIVGVLVNAVLSCLTAVGSVVVYHDLRVQKEHVDLDQIAKVFD